MKRFVLTVLFIAGFGLLISNTKRVRHKLIDHYANMINFLGSHIDTIPYRYS